MRVHASAPGKIVLAGEYAVLDGAPAISMAVDRRARVTLQRAEGGASSVTAPGYAMGKHRFRVERGRLVWQEGDEHIAVVDAIWRSAGLSRLAPVDISLDTRAFTAGDDKRKLGIGSSAAVTVALAAAVGSFAAEARNTGRIALAAHRVLQGGSGSGVDVATSLHGGVIEYRMGELPARPMTWPEGLHFALLWSGVPASTASRLKQLEAAEHQASRKELVRASGTVATAWTDGSAEAIVDALVPYTRVLRRFSADHGLGIFDAGHDELADAAPDGVVYKPCGAGGGDIGIAIALADSALEDFAQSAQRRGFERLPLAIDDRGVESKRDDD